MKQFRINSGTPRVMGCVVFTAHTIKICEDPQIIFWQVLIIELLLDSSS